MMMRYLGLGVGHQNPSDFPREDGDLPSIPSGAHYVYTSSDDVEVGGDGNGHQDDEIYSDDEEVEDVGYEF